MLLYLCSMCSWSCVQTLALVYLHTFTFFWIIFGMILVFPVIFTFILLGIAYLVLWTLAALLSICVFPCLPQDYEHTAKICGREVYHLRLNKWRPCSDFSFRICNYWSLPKICPKNVRKKIKVKNVRKCLPKSLRKPKIFHATPHQDPENQTSRNESGRLTLCQKAAVTYILVMCLAFSFVTLMISLPAYVYLLAIMICMCILAMIVTSGILLCLPNKHDKTVKIFGAHLYRLKFKKWSHFELDLFNMFKLILHKHNHDLLPDLPSKCISEVSTDFSDRLDNHIEFM